MPKGVRGCSKLLDHLKRDHKAGKLRLTGGLAHLAEPDQFAPWLSACYDRYKACCNHRQASSESPPSRNTSSV